MPNKRTIRSAHSIEYSALKHAMDRCTNPNHAHYYNYGGRGITVDASFYGTMGFYRFIEEVGLRPGDEYSLDRIDNDKGYEPGNLRWATRIQQQANRRKSQANMRDYGWGFGYHSSTMRDGRMRTAKSPIIEHPKTQDRKTLRAWADELGLATSTLRQRLQKNWPLDQALTSTLFTPSGQSCPKPQAAVPPPPPPPAQVINNVIDLLDASITAISGRTH